MSKKFANHQDVSKGIIDFFLEIFVCSLLFSLSNIFSLLKILSNGSINLIFVKNICMCVCMNVYLILSRIKSELKPESKL